MAVTKLQLADWRNHPVTQELFNELRSNTEHYTARIINRIRPDVEEDQWIRAYAMLASDVLMFNPQIISEAELVEVEDVED